MIYFIIWLVINIVTAYNFTNLTCPHPGQWELRARAKNCSSIQNYVCLFDTAELAFDDECIGPYEERKGNKLTLNEGNFDRIECSSTHYQPLQFFSFGNTNCTHLKSPCSEEGQVIADNGTSYSDRSCRCDYRQGYAFVNDTSVHCSCMPSKEECTCFQKPCRENEVLSPDYKCIKEIEQPGNCTCSQLLDKNSIESGTADVNPMYDFSNRYYDTDTVYRYRARVVCWIFIAIIIVLCLLLRFCGNQIESLINNLKNRFTEFRNICKKDYFVEPLEEIVKCLEGETVTLSCEVNKERTTGIWFKDDEKLNSESPDIRLIADGKFHKLEIVNVRIENRGYYTLKIKKIACTSLLLVIDITTEQINYLRLIYLLETVAQPAVKKIFDKEFHPSRLRKTLDENKSRTLETLRKKKHLNKEEYDMLFPIKVVDYSVKIKLRKYDFRKINEEKKKTIEKEVATLYKNVVENLKVSFTLYELHSKSVVLKLTSSSDIKTMKNTIEKAVIHEGNIGNIKTESSGFSLTQLGDTSVPVKSQDFDIRLMMVLMKNLANFDISEKLPLKDDTSEVADLSRIKFIRNTLEQNIDKKTSDDEFEKNWKQLTEAVIRLDGIYEKTCQNLKKFKPTPHQCQKYLTSKNIESDSGSVESLDKWKELMSKQSIQKEAKDAVQKIFDEQFPPETLRKEVYNRFEYLSNLKEQKEITQSEWKHLNPPEYENISSGTFDTRLMLMLLKESPLKETPKLKAMENLNNLLSKTDLDYRAIKTALTEVTGDDDRFY